LVAGGAPSSCGADAGIEDGGESDGESDGGIVEDSGTSDARPDAGPRDTGTVDIGVADAGQTCDESHEPNDTRGQAFDLGAIDDDAAFPGGVVESFVGDRDFDWFTFVLNDAIIAGAEPRAEVDAFGVPSGAGVSACIYYECDSGVPVVECRAGSPSTFDALPGCCASGATSAVVELGPDCPGITGTQGRAWVRVEGIGEPVCDPYSLRWGG
jgi:hypothetical protein